MTREDYYWNWYVHEGIQHLCDRKHQFNMELTACPLSVIVEDNLPFCQDCCWN